MTSRQFYQQRLKDLEKNLTREGELLKHFEDKLCYETDPRMQGRYREDIHRQKEAINKFQREYQELKDQLSRDSSNQIKYQPSQYLKFKFRVVTLKEERSGLFGLGLKVKLSQNDTFMEAEYFAEKLGSGVSLSMVYIPGGSFWMGSPDTEKERYSDESPQHKVTVQAFFMGKFQVTQKQWRAIASLPRVNRPSGKAGGRGQKAEGQVIGESQ